MAFTSKRPVDSAGMAEAPLRAMALKLDVSIGRGDFESVEVECV